MNEDLRAALASELATDSDKASARRPVVTVELDDLTRLVRRALGESAGRSADAVYEAESRLAAALDTYQRIDLLRARLEEHRADVHDELSRLRATLVARRGFVEDQVKPAAWPVDPERWHTLRLRVQARLAEFAEQKGAEAPPSRLVAADLLDLFAKERAASLAELRRRSDFEVGQLERRLARLDASLEEAGELLAAVRNLPQLETGLASHYREVAGLDDGARQRERKTSILQQIFRANCELQERLGPKA